MYVLATTRAKVAKPQSSRRGGNLTEEGVKSIAVGHIRRKLGVAAVKQGYRSPFQKFGFKKIEKFGPFSGHFSPKFRLFSGQNYKNRAKFGRPPRHSYLTELDIG